MEVECTQQDLTIRFLNQKNKMTHREEKNENRKKIAKKIIKEQQKIGIYKKKS